MVEGLGLPAWVCVAGGWLWAEVGGFWWPLVSGFGDEGFLACVAWVC